LGTEALTVGQMVQELKGKKDSLQNAK